MARNYLSNEQMLLNYGAIFQNLAQNSELSNQLAEYGYGTEKIEQGKGIYNKARAEYDKNKSETAKENTAHQGFKSRFDEMVSLYYKDRKKAKIVFKDQPDVLRSLEIKGQVSKSIANLLSDARIFYRMIFDNAEWRSAVEILKISSDDIANQLRKIEEITQLYDAYLQGKGTSQQATKDKDKAFSDLEKWVKDFYAVAKIALEDRPQLLESLGRLVKG